ERHAAQQQDRLEGRDEAIGHMRVEERRVISSDDDVDLAEQVEGSATSHAVHGRDDRLPDFLALRTQYAPGVVVRQWVVLVPRRDDRAVDSGTKRLVAALLAGLIAAGTAAASPQAKAAPFAAAGSARQVYATGVKGGSEVALVNSAGHRVATNSATPQGGVLFRNVKPGSGYRVDVL